MKGPVAIDGISLTVMAKDDHSFSVSLVQYTQEHTNLHTKKPGDRVNLETDIIARYVDAMLEDRREAARMTRAHPRIERTPCSRSCRDHREKEAQRAKALATVEEAIEEYRNGRFVIIIDDEDRENEGDLDDPGAVRDAGGDQLHGALRPRPDLRADDGASASSSCTSR